MLTKIIKLTVLFVIILAIAFALWKGTRWSLGFLAAAVWSIINFSLTLGLLDMAVLKKPQKQLKLFLFIKFPVLYLTGFAILASAIFPVMSILAGLLLSAAILGIMKLFGLKSIASIRPSESRPMHPRP